MRERALDALLAAALALGAFALLGDIGFDLTDEGYLWYGVTRAELGDVPRLDFRGYDPGRYYWCAAWAKVFGSGLMEMRLSLALYSAVGLFFGLRIARRAVPAGRGLPLLLLAIGVVLAIWTFPRHKVFEHTAVLINVFVIVRWLEQRDARRALVAGIWTGFALFMGRNHALYAGFSGVAVLGWIAWREPGALFRASIAGFAGGVVVGLLPTLAMMVAVPGYAATNWQLATALVARDSNLGSGVPWPWTIDFARETPSSVAHLLGTGLSYMLMCIVYALGAFAVLRTPAADMRRRAVFAACIIVGVIWAHHAAVRAGAAHFAQAAHPLWLAVFSAPFAFEWAQRRRAALASALVLLGLSASVPLFADGRWSTLVSGTSASLEVGNDRVRAQSWMVDYVGKVDRMVADHVDPETPLLIAPFDPGLYAYLDRKSPIYDTYSLWPATEEAQREAIAELERQDVNWALIGTTILVGSPQTHYSKTNPLLWEYLARNFEVAPGVEQIPGRTFLRRREGPAAQD